MDAGAKSRKWLIPALGLVLLSSSMADPVSAAPPSPQAGADATAISDGKYIAIAADCAACHTAPGGQSFAGGAPLKSAFGTLYGSNITSDSTTGIGSWTEADFERALRSGVRKDGAYLYPAMPYGSYTKMSAADMHALWSYIHSIAPVNSKPPENTLPFPLTIRSGMAVWLRLYFTPGPFVRNTHHDTVWNRGAYLVQALGHCADCHTPRNLAQGLEKQHTLTGAQVSGWYAPDISNDSLSKIDRWQTVDLERYLKSGVAPGNVKSFGPMQEVVHDSLKHLTDNDLHAMAVYLKNQDVDATPSKPAPVKLPPERLAAGKAQYADHCSTCHQSNGRGISGSVPSLVHNDAVTASEPYNTIMAMLQGFPPQGTWGAMASFAVTMNDDQIADIANYVRTAWGNAAAPNATPWSVSDWRKNVDNPQNESNALLCPNLTQDVIKPALEIGSTALQDAARDPTQMIDIVSRYIAARPQSSTAQVIEALSTAYCKQITKTKISQTHIGEMLADFAQRVAIAARQSKTST